MTNSELAQQAFYSNLIRACRIPLSGETYDPRLSGIKRDRLRRLYRAVYIQVRGIYLCCCAGVLDTDAHGDIFP